MKPGAILLALAGLLVTTLLVGVYGFGAIGHAMLQLRWEGFLLIGVYHLGLFCLLGLAWRAVVPAPRPVGVFAFVWGRLVRDSAGDVLPFSQFGGFAMGARAISLQGLPGAVAVGSTVVDATVELLAELVYIGLGLALMVWLLPPSTLAAPVALGLRLAVAVVAIFVLFQWRGLKPIERLAERFVARSFPAAVTQLSAVRAAIQSCWRNPAGLGQAFLIQLAAWVVGGVETWIALRLMGVPIGLVTVLMIENLVYGVRNVAFFVPDAIGIQEGAYVLLGQAFGLTPEIALALSLLKRARDVAIGVPVLLAWQALEGRRAWQGASSPGAAGRHDLLAHLKDR